MTASNAAVAKWQPARVCGDEVHGARHALARPAQFADIVVQPHAMAAARAAAGDVPPISAADIKYARAGRRQQPDVDAQLRAGDPATVVDGVGLFD